MPIPLPTQCHPIPAPVRHGGQNQAAPISSTGCYGASIDDARLKLSYDLYYVCRRSLFLDLLILIATVRVVLFQEGSR